MQTKTVKCPSCGVVLEVRNSKSEELKIINCPNCSMILRVRFGRQVGEIMDAETHIAGSGEDGNTMLVGTTPTGDKAVIVCGGRRYELHEGRNIVGRRASTSIADIQIDVADQYMSRLNAIINVKKSGAQLLVTISNYKNQNPMMVGTMKLLSGDEMVLGNNDVFTMGKTRMTLNIEKDEN